MIELWILPTFLRAVAPNKKLTFIHVKFAQERDDVVKIWSGVTHHLDSFDSGIT